MENYTSKHLNSMNLKHCSQTCSNGHLCKTTNAESAQANSCPIGTVQDDHLSNATRNYFFFVCQMKKNLSKTTTKLYPAKECKKTWGKKNKKQATMHEK